MKAVAVSGGVMARNTMLNLIGQVLPLLVGVVAMPFVVRGLGTERFGLLSLAWVVMGYFTIFDLGLGRATTKYVAEALGRGEDDRVPCIVWTAASFQAAMGLVGAFILFGVTDILVDQVLNVPPELMDETRDIFHMLALGIPVVLVSSSFSGVLEAAQRFELVNAVRIPSSTLTFLLPLVGLALGMGLPGIVALILLTRVGALVAFVMMCLHVVPKLGAYSVSSDLFSQLFAFGGWVTVSNIVGPILVYLDRFLIGSLLTIAAVGYYTAPYEIVTRLWVVSASMSMTLFPVFSALGRDRQRLGMLFSRALKYVLLTTGPLVVVLAIFSREILQIWLGSEFAMVSAAVMQILAFGVLINSLAYIPFALLQGSGRPDLPAKFHVLELPLYLVSAWLLVNEFGIAGAAGAWTLRVTIDAFLLFLAAFKLNLFSPGILGESGMRHAALGLVMLACIFYAMRAVAQSLSISVQAMLIAGVLVAFAWAAWSRALDDMDRRAILRAAKVNKMLEIR